MAFIGGQDLVSFFNRYNVIMLEDGMSGYLPSRIKQAAYELSLGSEVYLTDCETKVSTKLNNENDTVNINPGQFALLLTEEIVCMPKDKLGFISIKASEKLKGLINVSGFHVDPGFKGKLLYSVYNASPSVIQLRKGEQYFLIWFSELRNKLDDQYIYNSKNHQNQDKIDPKYITPLINGEIASPNELLKKIGENRIKIESVETSKKLKHEKVFWALVSCLSALITLNIAFWINKNDYIKGYNDAIKETELIKLIDKGEIYTNDSLILKKIDYLIDKSLKKRNVKAE